MRSSRLVSRCPAARRRCDVLLCQCIALALVVAAAPAPASARVSASGFTCEIVANAVDGTPSPPFAESALGFLEGSGSTTVTIPGFVTVSVATRFETDADGLRLLAMDILSDFEDAPALGHAEYFLTAELDLTVTGETAEYDGLRGGSLSGVSIRPLNPSQPAPAVGEPLPPGTYHLTLRQGRRIEDGEPGLAESGEILMRFLRPCEAGDFRWNQPAGGSYSVDSNWDPACVPVDGGGRQDRATFGPVQTDPSLPAVTTYQVATGGNATAGQLVIDAVTLTLAGNISVAGATRILNAGSLTLPANSQLAGDSLVAGETPGPTPTDEASLVLTTATSSLLLSNALTVGQGGRARVTVEHGRIDAGSLSIGDNAEGKLEIGFDDARLDVSSGSIAVGGAQGLGTLSIALGAQVFAADVSVGQNQLTDPASGVTNSIIAIAVGPSGPALLQADNIHIGSNGGRGEAQLFSGGVVRAVQKLTIGETGPGRVFVTSTVTPQLSKLEVGDVLQVGKDDAGRLEVLSGGRVEAKSLQVNVAGPTGSTRVEIDGEGTPGAAAVTVSQDLGVGATTTAGVPSQIELKNGGLLTARATVIGNAAAPGGEAVMQVGPQAGGDTVAAELRIADPQNASTITGGGLAVVGGTSAGRMVVNGGGVARLTGGLDIAQQARGEITVDNRAGGNLRSSLFLFGPAFIGDGAEGKLTVSNGGLIESATDISLGDGSIDVFNDSGFTADRASLLMDGNRLRLGEGGRGGLSVRGNGLLRCAELVVGSAIAGEGTMTVDTGGEVVCLDSAQVGASAPGRVEIGTGGVVEVANTLDIQSFGTVRMNGGLLRGGVARVGVNGRLEGTGTVQMTKVNVGGFISPGLSPGTLTIDGDYEQPEGGVLVIEVGGTGPGEFDVLHVTGDAVLAGTVDLRFVNGFVPQEGDAFDFVVVDGTITGILRGDLIVPAGGEGDGGDGGGGGAGGGGGDAGSSGNTGGGGDAGGDTANGSDTGNGGDGDADGDTGSGDGGSGDGVGGGDGGGGDGGDTGNTDTPPAADPADQGPDALVDIRWEVTPEGTCRVTVTDVKPVEVVAPPAARVAFCGAGAAPMLILAASMLCLHAARRRLRADAGPDRRSAARIR